MKNLAALLVKAVALLGGAAITLISLMALVGQYTDNGWVRAGIAIVAALVVPLVTVELILRLLGVPNIKGLITDVVAVSYVGFAIIFVGLAHDYTEPMLQDEGGRLERAGMPRMARTAYALGGGRRTRSLPPVAVAEPVAKAPAPAVPKPDEPKPTLRAGDGKERTPAQLFAEFAPSVVTIQIKTPFGDGGGTGFILDGAGTIGTNYHVIERAAEIKVKLMDGTFADEVEILAENEAQDLALLRIKTTKPLPPVVLGDSDKITVGERAVSIGNPVGLEHTLTDGLVSARRLMEGKKMIQMSTPVSPGNSGGPLFNIRAEVIGVTTAVYTGGSFHAQNLNLAMPINDLKSMLRPEYPGRHKVGESAAQGGRW